MCRFSAAKVNATCSNRKQLKIELPVRKSEENSKPTERIKNKCKSKNTRKRYWN